jgi:hypothetical protein
MLSSSQTKPDLIAGTYTARQTETTRSVFNKSATLEVEYFEACSHCRTVFCRIPSRGFGYFLAIVIMLLPSRFRCKNLLKSYRYPAC